MRTSDPIVFVSDVHLSEQSPDCIQLFLKFLQGPAQQAQSLYILGDLFDYWMGDDCIPTWVEPVIRALRALSDSGKTLYFMAGNRDFLIGKRFSQLTGCTLLEDPHLIHLEQGPVVLMHGDLLCTQDVAYQRFRKVIRHPVTRFIYRHLPRKVRQKVAKNLRQTSRQHVQTKAFTQMDAVEQAILAVTDRLNAQQLIHGHTHRPFHHIHRGPSAEIHRWVLGDWHDMGTYLTYHNQSFALIEFS